MLKVFILLISPILYFSISWYVNWESFAPDSTISPSYLFDIIFSLSVFTIFKKVNFYKKLKIKPFIIRIIFITIIAILSVSTARFFEILSPFKYVENLLLQMLILAPIIEELVFRGAFFEIQKYCEKRTKVLLFFNAILFSLSHLSGIFNLPIEFHGFIFFQMIYTLILGWVCAKSRLESQGFFEPILLHFCFNLVFYIGVLEFGL